METEPIGLVQIVVLALIQGVTEFLPVSSSAHLILPSALTDWPDQGLAFDVAVHLGTLAAVIAYFRRDMLSLASSAVGLSAGRVDESAELLFKLAVATVPLVLAGLAFREQVEAHLRSTTVIASATIAFGLALWWADRRRSTDIGPPQTPSYPQAILIGCAQALALIPGTSRSGITITAALALGLSRLGAARFAFLLAIPAIAGAALLTGLDAEPPLPWFTLGLGFLVAGTTAYLCISGFLALLQRTGMAPYAIYRVALGTALLVFFDA